VTLEGGGQTDLTFEFQIDQWSTQAPNMMWLRIYNPSLATAKKLAAPEFTKVQFYAGYDDNCGLVYSGEIKQAILNHDTAVNSCVDLYCADGESGYNRARLGTALPAGYTPQDKLNAALKTMQPFGVTLGTVNVDLSKPSYPRGLPLIGMAREAIREVALNAGALWSIQNGQLHMIDFKKPVPGSAIPLNAATGLVGWPRQTADGIMTVSLINPRLQPHVNIQLDPSSIQLAQRNINDRDPSSPYVNSNLDQQGVGAGTYNIFKMARTGNTRGEEWYDTAWSIGTTSSAVSKSNTEQGYYVGTD
jgi:hypothetical protein